MKEGLWLPDGQFESREFIRRKLAPPAELNPPPFAVERSLQDWTEIAQKRQQERDEILKIPHRVEINHNENTPVFYALIGDTHIGGEDVDYQRLNNEVAEIKDTKGAFVVTLGDLTDNFFFVPAVYGDIFNLEEQAHYAQQLLGELKGHLVAAVSGNHDLWSDARGLSIYHKFIEEYQAHYLEGLSYLNINVYDSKFNMAVSHKYGGHSIYNSAHPAHRVFREEGEGADVIVTAHTHKKAVNRQTVKGFNGGRQILYISLGAYKTTDKYSRGLGHAPMDEDEQGGVGLIMYPQDKRIDVHWSIEQGLKEFKKL